MAPDNPEKLLGGYAAGNLTPEERARLFEAALENQTLFDALMEEEPLREVLADPVAKARLRRSLASTGETACRAQAWFRRPLAWSLAGGFAAVVFVSGFVAWRLANEGPVTQRLEMAKVSRPSAVMESTPAAPPAVSKPARPAARAFAPPAENERAESAPPLPEPPVVAQSPAAAPAQSAAPANIERSVASGFASSEAAKSDDASRRVADAAPAAGGRMVPRREKSAAAVRALGVQSAMTLTPAPLRHIILRRDAAGAWQPLAGAPLSAGDALRLRIVSARSGELQVRVRDVEGVWRPLLAPGVRIDAGTPRTVPDAGEILLEGEQQITITVTPDDAGPALTENVTLTPR
jgi:hypothetical protein